MNKKYTKAQERRMLQFIKKYRISTPKGAMLELAKELDVKIESLSNKLYALRIKHNIPHGFNEKEIKIIRNTIKNNPYNLKENFKKIAKRLHCAEPVVEKYYYNRLRKERNSKLFCLLGFGNHKYNCKVIRKDSKIKPSRTRKGFLGVLQRLGLLK